MKKYLYLIGIVALTACSDSKMVDSVHFQYVAGNDSVWTAVSKDGHSCNRVWPKPVVGDSLPCAFGWNSR